MIDFVFLLIIVFIFLYLIASAIIQKILKSNTGNGFVNHDLWYYKLNTLFKEKAYQKSNDALLMQSLNHFLLTNEDRNEDLLPFICKIQFPFNLFSKYYIRDEGYVIRYTYLSSIIDEEFRKLKLEN
jgi:hypothetical protein